MPKKTVNDMTPEDLERYDQDKARKKTVQNYHDKLYDHVTKKKYEISKNLDKISAIVKNLESVEDLINEGNEIGGEALNVIILSPANYNLRISEEIQNAVELIMK